MPIQKHRLVSLSERKRVSPNPLVGLPQEPQAHAPGGFLHSDPVGFGWGTRIHVFLDIYFCRRVQLRQAPECL